MKKITWFGIALFIVFVVMLIIWNQTPDFDEVIQNKFIENQDLFGNIVKYYENLDFVTLLEKCESDSDIQIANINYRVGVDDKYYYLNLNEETYESFNSEILNGNSIEQILGEFSGFRVDIDKNNFQLSSIRIEISDYESDFYSVLCWSSQENTDNILPGYKIELPGKWYIFRVGLV